MFHSIHFKSFPSAPQEQGSDDEEVELTPAEVVQRMKVCLCSLHLRPLHGGHGNVVVGFDFARYNV